MTILQTKFAWKNALTKRQNTRKIVLHHAAAKTATVQQIHQWHFYVRKDGSVYQGRPIDMLGAHCHNNNSDSIGICFEGNFENETMGEVQIKAGQELIAYVLNKYPGLKIYGHKDFNATGCPGKNFPMSRFTSSKANSHTNNTTGKDGDNVTTVKRGSKGTDVKVLQALLNVNGANLTVDGDFGAGTDTAVKTFQKTKGLTADGVVGTKTWEALSAVKVTNNTPEITALKNKIANAIKALS